MARRNPPSLDQLLERLAIVRDREAADDRERKLRDRGVYLGRVEHALFSHSDTSLEVRLSTRLPAGTDVLVIPVDVAEQQ